MAGARALSRSVHGVPGPHSMFRIPWLFPCLSLVLPECQIPPLWHVRGVGASSIFVLSCVIYLFGGWALLAPIIGRPSVPCF